LQLCKSFFYELDRHLHEVVAPRLDELGMRKHGAAWPAPPQGYGVDLEETHKHIRMAHST
jgi:hypothetical protein